MAREGPGSAIPAPVASSAADALESWLGDPHDPDLPFSFAASVAADEAEAWPGAACTRLRQWGMASRHLDALDGEAGDLDRLAALYRLVARRDATVAWLSLADLEAAAAVALAEDRALQTALAQRWRAAERVLWAVPQEPAAAPGTSALTATVSSSGYVLDGDLPLAYGPAEADALVIAALCQGRGDRAVRLFVVPRRACRQHLVIERLGTVGLRGAGLATARLASLPVAAGDSFAIVDRASLRAARQVFGVVAAAIPLGATDTALRSTLDFASQRRLYGHTVLELPRARRLLVDSFVDLLLCETVIVCACRAVHVAPAEVALWSALIYGLVVPTLSAAVRRLAVVLGARYFLRQGHWWGIYQKIVRDVRAFEHLFTAAPVALETLGRAFRARKSAPRRSCAAAWTAIVGDRQRLPRLDSIVPFGAGPAASAFWTIFAHRASMLPGGGELEERLAQRGRELASAAPATDAATIGYRCGWLQIAAIVGQTWSLRRDSAAADRGAFFAGGSWLTYGLQRILGRLGEPSSANVTAEEAETEEEIAAALLRRFADNRLFSLSSIAVAASIDQVPRHALADRAG